MGQNPNKNKMATKVKKQMKSVREIIENYNDGMIGIEIIRDKLFPKRLTIKSWWGKHNIYENICRDLRREGYTIFS